MDESRQWVIHSAALSAFVAAMFVRAGCSEAEGERIGHYLVSAKLSGHDSHGVVRVPMTLDFATSVVAEGKVASRFRPMR